MSEVIRLAVRVYRQGVLQSVDRVGIPAREIDEVLPLLAEKHAQMMATVKGHIEIEFLDEPDVSKRFFRIGTDTSGMVNPCEVDLEDPGESLHKWKGR